VENAAESDRYVTVVVERDGRTFVSESSSLFAGGREVFTGVVSRGGTYDVVVETAAGDRVTDTWTVEPAVDGLSVVLDGDGVSLWRTARCVPDCAASEGGEAADLPLTGDGRGRWYSAADLVLRNPGETPTQARARVSLDEESILDYRYRVPARTDLAIPTTFRTGLYDVRVDAGGRSLADEWHVPEEPRRYYRLGSAITATCGPAATVLRLENHDERSHRLAVSVARDGTPRFTDQRVLDADEAVALRPAVDPGRYRVTVEMDGTRSVQGDWWACSRHGFATAFVDATGDLTFRQSLPAPG
jgi:hypothetical protein